MKLFKLLLLLPIFGYSQLTESVIFPLPDSLGANIIRCDSVELNWVSDTATISSVIEWDTSGFTIGSGMVINTANNPEIITGLSPNTAYDFYVKDSCLSDTSIWVGPFTFNTGNVGAPLAAMSAPIYLLNPTLGSIFFDATPSSGFGNSYFWEFGDGNSDTGSTVTHDYQLGGNYVVALIVQNTCGRDTIFTHVTITFDFSLLPHSLADIDIDLYPNPASETLTVDWQKLKSFVQGDLKLEVYSMIGEKVMEEQIILATDFSEEIDISQLSKGSYLFKLEDRVKTFKKTVITVL
jgi:PKD repeat protein